MKAREIVDGIHWLGVVDWDRRLFDALIPLHEGTSYNAYLVRGSEATALVDTVEPTFASTLFARLDSLGIDRIDYVVANHAEQDHSGTLPQVLERFPEARVLCTPKAEGMLRDLLVLPDGALRSVADGEEVSLGDRTLRFIHVPWVHWPETMVTLCPEARILFPCDLFGSHLATNELIARDPGALLEASKLYYAQIMMPFRKMIARKLPEIEALELDLICPSHGPIHGRPGAIIDAYRGWTGERVRNQVTLPFISMHESTRIMVDRLIDALTDRDVRVERFNVEKADIGRLAMSLVDSATVVFGTPTVLGGPHPNVMVAALLADLLRPRTRYASVIGSYGWGGKTVDRLLGAMPTLKVEVLDPVLWKGRPDDEAFAALDRLAGEIAERHAAIEAV